MPEREVVVVPDGAFAELKTSENRLLVVEDGESLDGHVARALSEAEFVFETASGRFDALARLDNDSFALVLIEMNVAGDLGLDLLAEIRRRRDDVATIVVTGEHRADLADTAMRLGAFGYIIKPFKPVELVIDVANALRRRTLEIESSSHRQRLEDMVRQRTTELWDAVNKLEEADLGLRMSYEETVRRLSLAAEYRDDETARHIRRMSRYCDILGQGLGLPLERIEMIRMASIMHDVGKIGIPDEILLKPGKLSVKERVVMQSHTEIGYQILSGSGSELLNCAATIALNHHERFDGAGYPRGLSDEDIPLEGRIAAIADVFDALTSDRVYKKAYPWTRALTVMREERGKHFDPELLDVFLDNMDQVVAVKGLHPEDSERALSAAV